MRQRNGVRRCSKLLPNSMTISWRSSSVVNLIQSLKTRSVLLSARVRLLTSFSLLFAVLLSRTRVCRLCLTLFAHTCQALRTTTISLVTLSMTKMLRSFATLMLKSLFALSHSRSLPIRSTAVSATSVFILVSSMLVLTCSSHALARRNVFLVCSRCTLTSRTLSRLSKLVISALV